MSLSSDLISQFVKATNDKEEVKKESIVYGTTVKHNNTTYVKLDGSDILTPIATTADTQPGERVTVMIKNHTATITGNLSSPAARSDDIKDIAEAAKKITEFEIVLADKVDTEELNAEKARIDALVADNVTIKQTLVVAEGDIDKLQVSTLNVTEKLTAAEGNITKLQTEKLDVTAANAKFATIENLEATNADLYDLESTYADFVVTTTDKLSANDASIKDLEAKKLSADQADLKYATIVALNAEKARIDDLEADVADIDTLIFGSATGSVIHSSFSNAVIAQLGDAQIKSAMIESIAADKITSGDIITNNVRVMSEDGSLLISDETIQISDETRVRVQIGKDAAGDYSINIWDADGKLMFSEGGITDNAIKNAIIRNDMVSDTANIAAHKLDIDSLFEEINGSEKTIKSTQIYLDDEKQTLDVAFKTMTTDIEELQNGVSSQGTQITAIQGQIASKIWEQDITTATSGLETTTETLSTQYSTLEQEVDGISATVASHTSEINKKADNTTVTEVSNRVSSIETNLSGFQSTVSTTYATKAEMSNIEVGARNLLLNTGNNSLPVMSNGANMVANGTDYVNSVNGITTMACNTSTREIYYRFMTPTESSSNLYGLEIGKSYTLSGKVQVTTTSGTLDRFATRIQTYNPSTAWAELINETITSTDTTDWVDFSSTFIVPETADGIYVSFQLYYADSWVGTILAKNLQLEKGTLATDWSPAPEDYPTVESVSAAQSTADAAQASVDTLEVGGRNLLLNSKSFKGSNIVGTAATIDPETYKGFNVRSYDASALETGYVDIITYTNLYAEELGSTYTLSFYAKGSGDSRLCTYFHGGTGYVRISKIIQSSGVTGTAADGASYWSLTDTWQRYWVTWTLKDEGDISIIRHVLFRLWFGGTASICGVKLEKGEKATDWTPAPEDTETDIATAQAAAEAAQAAANQNAEDMANIVTNFNSDIANLQTQIDGSITTWFYEGEPTTSNEPAVNWNTTELKNAHLKDLYYDTDSGYCYRWQIQNNVYSWQRITDTDVTKALADAKTAQDTADQKRRVFYTQPAPPYDAGDLWVQGSGGDILRCQTAKVNGQSYNSSDWVAASKYTDDTVANSAVDKADAAQSAADAAQSDIDNLKIGGRNLLPNSKGDDITGWAYAGTVVADSVKGSCVQRTNTTTSGENYIGSTRTGIVEPSTEYTFSADIWVNEYFKPYEIFWLSDTEETKKTGSGYVNVKSRGMNTVTPNVWTRVTWTFTTNANDYTGYIRFDNNGTTEEGNDSILRVANLKLEKGNRATDWTPAPEDLEERVTTAETKIIQNENSITSLAGRTTTVENKFAGYFTKEETNSAITQSANSITSSVSQTYTTKTEFKSLGVGGRNLVAGTDKTREYVGNASESGNGYKDVWSGKTIDIVDGTEYIVSFDAKGDVEQTIRCHFYSPNTTTSSLSSTGQHTTGADGSCDVSITTEWARYWVKWTQTPAGSRKSIIVGRTFDDTDIYIRAVKFEAGNIPTDWTLAPEDMATADELASVQSSSDLVETRVTTAETLIEQLSDCISTLVTDGNGESLMTQTANGWTFSTKEIQDIVDTTSENLNTLTNEVGDIDSTVGVLQQAVDDLGVISEYVKIGTYEGEPCIELGETDSDFKLLITNTRILFMEGTGVPAYINNQSLFINKAVIEEELQQGEFVWKVRSNGNLGLIWKGATS